MCHSEEISAGFTIPDTYLVFAGSGSRTSVTQMSRVERLKAGVQPLLTGVTVGFESRN